MSEIWKDIRDFEGSYQVSNKGRIRNVKTGYVKLPTLLNGYERVKLSGKAGPKTVYIHRIVAEAFLGTSYKDVKHKDKNRLNNNLSNLEYSNKSTSENVQNSTHSQNQKSVKCNKTGKEYKSIRKAASVLGISYTYLCDMLSGRRKNVTSLSL